jgi:hypothetical protein
MNMESADNTNKKELDALEKVLESKNVDTAIQKLVDNMPNLSKETQDNLLISLLSEAISTEAEKAEIIDKFQTEAIETLGIEDPVPNKK